MRARLLKGLWKEKGKVDCGPFSATLTLAGCEGNREKALRAARLLYADLPIELCDDLDLDRLLACGRCNQNPDLSEDAISELVTTAVGKWFDREYERLIRQEEDWYRTDEEVKARVKKRRGERRRAKRREKHIVYMREYRILNQ